MHLTTTPLLAMPLSRPARATVESGQALLGSVVARSAQLHNGRAIEAPTDPAALATSLRQLASDAQQGGAALMAVTPFYTDPRVTTITSHAGSAAQTYEELRQDAQGLHDVAWKLEGSDPIDPVERLQDSVIMRSLHDDANRGYFQLADVLDADAYLRATAPQHV